MSFQFCKDLGYHQTERHKKDWSSTVWFKGCVPKQAFNLWTAELDRLPTRTRLASWGITHQRSCPVCLFGGGNTRSYIATLRVCCWSLEICDDQIEANSHRFHWLGWAPFLDKKRLHHSSFSLTEGRHSVYDLPHMEATEKPATQSYPHPSKHCLQADRQRHP